MCSLLAGVLDLMGRQLVKTVSVSLYKLQTGKQVSKTDLLQSELLSKTFIVKREGRDLLFLCFHVW